MIFNIDNIVIFQVYLNINIFIYLLLLKRFNHVYDYDDECKVFRKKNLIYDAIS